MLRLSDSMAYPSLKRPGAGSGTVRYGGRIGDVGHHHRRLRARRGGHHMSRPAAGQIMGEDGGAGLRCLDHVQVGIGR